MTSSSELVFFRKRVVSSASCVINISLSFTLIPVMFLLFLRLMANISATNIKRRADIGHPCRMPLPSSKNSVACPLFDTQARGCLYIISIHFIKLGPKLKYFKVFIRKFHEIVSKAFSKSRKSNIPGLCLKAVYSNISIIVLMFSPMYLFFIYQDWSSLTIFGITFCNLVANNFVNIL